MKTFNYVVFATTLCAFFYSAVGLEFNIDENFDDNDLTTHPTWSGDLSKFINSNGGLRTNNNTVNDTFYLSTPITLNKTNEWCCDIFLSFSTSSANYVDVLLGMNSSGAKDASGYFLRIGGSKDEIALYRRDTLRKPVLLVDGLDKETHNFKGKIKVVRDSFGTWFVSYDKGFDGVYVSLDAIRDQTYSAFGYTGLVVRQSVVSFHNKHRFDNFYFGPIRIDSVPPGLKKLRVDSDTSIVLEFDQTINQTKLVVTNFDLDNNFPPE